LPEKESWIRRRGAEIRGLQNTLKSKMQGGNRRQEADQDAEFLILKIVE